MPSLTKSILILYGHAEQPDVGHFGTRELSCHDLAQLSDTRAPTPLGRRNYSSGSGAGVNDSAGFETFARMACQLRSAFQSSR